LHATYAVHIPQRRRIHLFTSLHPSPTLIFVGTMQILGRPSFFKRIFPLLLLFALAMRVPAAQQPAEKKSEIETPPEKEKNPAQIELLEKKSTPASTSTPNSASANSPASISTTTADSNPSKSL
jgi:hypothetical protein